MRFEIDTQKAPATIVRERLDRIATIMNSYIHSLAKRRAQHVISFWEKYDAYIEPNNLFQ